VIFSSSFPSTSAVRKKVFFHKMTPEIVSSHGAVLPVRHDKLSSQKLREKEFQESKLPERLSYQIFSKQFVKGVNKERASCLVFQSERRRLFEDIIL